MSQEIYVRISAVWRRVKNASVKVSGTWRNLLKIYVRVAGVWEQVYLRQRELTISADTSNYNAFTAFGSPANPAIFIITINSNVVVDSASTSNPAFNSGALPAGSLLKIINNGYIIGKGGAGGNGASQVYTGDGDCSNTTPATDGGVGGEAINAQSETILDNTNGYVFGGGGGGGGNESGALLDPGACTAGGGGGGGAGGGGGGAGGTATGGSPNNNGCIGENGTSGPSGVGGRLAGTEKTGACPQYSSSYYAGDYGEAGDGANHFVCLNDGAGGVAGKAVDLNGNSITWLGGNNSAQVKGAVS